MTYASDFNNISNNISYANASFVVSDAAGIELYGSSNNIIRNNIAYGNEDSGIDMYISGTTTDFPTPLSSSYNLVIGNLVYGNGDHGVDSNNSPYNTVVGNTVHGNGTAGINFEGEPGKGSHNAIIKNNIMSGNGFDPAHCHHFGGNLRVDVPSTSGTAADYNLYFQGRRSNRSKILLGMITNLDYATLASY